nr:immunoglobulin heavy chain junction region [Macaca mulatta]MOW33386.1 immunoglobulin heavy chain junction region [Macaca mulatta]MOW33547.1 immunoglobulin heavy chain junction region [Macaca mulatta]
CTRVAVDCTGGVCYYYYDSHHLAEYFDFW